MNRVPLLPRTDVWSEFEEGMLRRSWVIDRKPKGYRPTDRHVQSNMPLFFEGNGGGRGQSNIHSGRSMLKCIFFSNNRYKQTCREVPMIYIKMCILLQHLQSHWQTLQLVIIELWAKAIHATWHVHVVSKQMYFVFKRRASEKICFTP